VIEVFKKESENKNKNKLFDKFRMMLLFQVFLSVIIIIVIQIRKNPFLNNSRRETKLSGSLQKS